MLKFDDAAEQNSGLARLEVAKLEHEIAAAFALTAEPKHKIRIVPNY